MLAKSMEGLGTGDFGTSGVLVRGCFLPRKLLWLSDCSSLVFCLPRLEHHGYLRTGLTCGFALYGIQACP